VTWTTPSTSFTSGNWNRFVDADPLEDVAGGVDFNNTFSSENPWVFTEIGTIDFTGTDRNDST
jgi:predicted secreted acid phosphatase